MVSKPRGSAFGRLLRHWRMRAGMSQEALALAANTTSRHVSFLETGRSRPGVAMVQRLAEVLGVPLRLQNELFRSAGLSFAYPEHALDAPALRSVNFVLEQLLQRHEPYPAWVFHRGFVLVNANEAAQRFFPGLLQLSPEQVLELWFGAGPLRSMIENWEESARAGLASMRRDALRSEDASLHALLQRAEAMAGLSAEANSYDETVPIACPRFRVGAQVVRTISSVLRFDTAVEVTASELRVELMFPADEHSAQFFQSLASG